MDLVCASFRLGGCWRDLTLADNFPGLYHHSRRPHLFCRIVSVWFTTDVVYLHDQQQLSICMFVLGDLQPMHALIQQQNESIHTNKHLRVRVYVLLQATPAELCLTC
jgi:hypothetical protein